MGACWIENATVPEGSSPVSGWVCWGGEERTFQARGVLAHGRSDEIEDEGRRETQRRVHDFICGRVWPVACDSRWAHTMKFRRRFLLGAIANEALPRALQGYQVAANLEADMIKSLERIIAADKGDFSAKRKLRVLLV